MGELCITQSARAQGFILICLYEIKGFCSVQGCMNITNDEKTVIKIFVNLPVKSITAFVYMGVHISSPIYFVLIFQVHVDF